MTVEEKLRVSKEAIEKFCKKWKITEFALFGSVLREDFRTDSDVDVLVTFSPDSDWGVEHLLDMKEELEALFGRAVDLVENDWWRKPATTSGVSTFFHTWKPCMQRDDSLLLDMLQAPRQILEYTNGLQEPDFLSSRRDQDAVLLQCTVLGETAKRVSVEFQNTHSEIPWRKIIGFRNVVVHDYFQFDFHRAWKIASRDIPALINTLEPLVPPDSSP